jgi:hypothetical protein
LRDRLRIVGLVVAVPLLLAGPFHLHVYDEMRNGSLLGSTEHELLRESTFDGRLAKTPAVRQRLRDGLRDVPSIWGGMWARFPQHFEVRGPLLLVFAGASVAGLLGLALAGGRVLTTSGRAVGLVAAGLVGMTWVAMVVFWPFGSQGRFLLPAAMTALAGLVLGSAALLARNRPPHACVLASGGAWAVFLLCVDIMAMASTGP